MSRVCDPLRARARGWRRSARGLGLALVFALGGFSEAPTAAARDVVRVESVGVAAVKSDSASPRDAAVRRALLDAVRQTAEGLLATGVGAVFGDEPGGDGDLESEESERAELQRILGSEPLDYATRFQVVEDRGVGPALFGSDPDADTEYVVIVSVFVDRDKIRERLTRAGMLLAPTGQEPRIQSRLILEDIGEYWAYEEIRRVLLEELKVHAAIPREFAPGRAVLEVSAAQPARQLLSSLQRSVSDRMELVPLTVGVDEMRLRVELRDRPPADGESAEVAPFDTRNPNRY